MAALDEPRLKWGRPPGRNLAAPDQKYHHPKHTKGCLNGCVTIWGPLVPFNSRLTGRWFERAVWVDPLPLPQAPPGPIERFDLANSQGLKPALSLICTVAFTQTIKRGLISAANSIQPIQQVGLKGLSYVWCGWSIDRLQLDKRRHAPRMKQLQPKTPRRKNEQPAICWCCCQFYYGSVVE